MLFVTGLKFPISNSLMNGGIDRTELAERFVRMYCKMIFEDDVFHADPHPGNILINQKGDIYLLDFGAVTSLKPEMKTGLPEMIVAFTKNDTDGIVKAMKKMGFVGSGKRCSKTSRKINRHGSGFPPKRNSD